MALSPGRRQPLQATLAGRGSLAKVWHGYARGRAPAIRGPSRAALGAGAARQQRLCVDVAGTLTARRAGSDGLRGAGTAGSALQRISADNCGGHRHRRRSTAARRRCGQRRRKRWFDTGDRTLSAESGDLAMPDLA